MNNGYFMKGFQSGVRLLGWANGFQLPRVPMVWGAIRSWWWPNGHRQHLGNDGPRFETVSGFGVRPISMRVVHVNAHQLYIIIRMCNILSVSDVVCFLYPYPSISIPTTYLHLCQCQPIPPSLPRSLSLFLSLSLPLSLCLSVCLSVSVCLCLSLALLHTWCINHTSAFIICLGKHTVPIRYFAFPVMISAASFLLGLGIQNYCQQQNWACRTLIPGWFLDSLDRKAPASLLQELPQL